jgi:tetratricopeptide (TPR) repeat protein
VKKRVIAIPMKNVPVASGMKNLPVVTPMKKLLLATVVICSALAGVAVAGSQVAPGNSTAATADGDLRYADSTSTARAATVRFYEKRLEEDPVSALDMATLAALNLEEGRIAGNPQSFVIAEELARRSISTRDVRNSRSSALLVSILLAQHRFTAAREVAQALVSEYPETPEYRAILAEVEMELGNYDAARELLNSVYGDRGKLAFAPRFARWAELNGAPYEAIRIARKMRDEVLGRTDLAPSRALWFHLRLIDLNLRYGRTGDAMRAVNVARRSAPNDWRLLAAEARTQLQRRKPRLALMLAERVVAINADAETLSLLSDVYAATSDSSHAADVEAALETTAASLRNQLHRNWSLRLLDSNRRLAEVLAAATTDTVQRRDIYGYDLVAWALFRNRRVAEAHEIMKKALRLGTKDPQLLYHGAIIAAAFGDTVISRKLSVEASHSSRALSDAQNRVVRAIIAKPRRGDPGGV